MSRKKYTEEERREKFWSRVIIENLLDCWVWTGGTVGRGYGYLSRGGPKLILAHRYVWEITYGPIPDGLCILHKCDNPPCVNPTHLYIGTHSDNMRDMIERGRGRNQYVSHYT